MTSQGLTWTGAVFMLLSWGGILSLLVFCFARLLNGKRPK